MQAEIDSVAVLQDEVFGSETKALWVFAYGSLCWKPGFEFHKAVTGHVTGYNRRFWQGNTTHRGTEENPGRVATLIEDRKGIVHGVAFAISGEAALPYLAQRECKLGGYVSSFATFYPQHGAAFKVLLYVATPDNPHWMGEADVSTIAEQVVTSRGPSGHNVEYVVRLANFMREHFPHYHDHHLFSIEGEILKRINSLKMCLNTLMGSGEGCVSFIKRESRNSSPTRDQQHDRIESFEHTARVPEKTLRCLNI